MKRERTHYDRSFKLMVVELAEAKGSSIPGTAEELGIKTDLIRRWTREHRERGSTSFSGHGVPGLTEEQKEIARLRKELSANTSCTAICPSPTPARHPARS